MLHQIEKQNKAFSPPEVWMNDISTPKGKYHSPNLKNGISSIEKIEYKSPRNGKTAGEIYIVFVSHTKNHESKDNGFFAY